METIVFFNFIIARKTWLKFYLFDNHTRIFAYSLSKIYRLNSTINLDIHIIINVKKRGIIIITHLRGQSHCVHHQDTMREKKRLIIVPPAKCMSQSIAQR